MRTTSACITKAYYHARIGSVTEIRAKTDFKDCYESLFVSISDSAPRQVVGRHFDGDTIAHEDADTILAHLAGNRGEHDVVTVVETHFEEGVGLFVDNRALRRD